MLRPKKEKSNVKLTKDSYSKALKIFGYLKPYGFVYLIGWLFLILSTSTGLIFPYLMGKLLGGTANGISDSSSAIRLISLDTINSVAIALFVLFAFQAIFSFFRVVIFTNVTENALRDLRNDAFSRLIYMPIDFYNKNKVGELISTFKNNSGLIISIKKEIRELPSTETVKWYSLYDKIVVEEFSDKLKNPYWHNVRFDSSNVQVLIMFNKNEIIEFLIAKSKIS